MPELAYRNGQFIPSADLSLAIHDAGFVQGVTVAEQMRTFRGKLFRLEEHLQRLRNALDVVGIAGIELATLANAARELAENNHGLLDPADDLGLSLFVTPGPYPTFAPPGPSGPTIGMHTYLIPFHLWADTYETGQKLVVSSVRQVPANCWPPELKCRSRMHYFLADREAQRRDAGARALLLDQDGFVTEASTANLVIFNEADGFVSPPREKILPGVSVAVLEELSKQLGVTFSHRDLTVGEVQSADEVILSSTSPCLLPATSLDGNTIGLGRGGETLQKALAAWSDLVGLDIVEQAQRFVKATSAERLASGAA
jgi:branched-subunit amino acid aminotransferase/4-amino-4-deoxychorismate lyase